MGEDRRIGIDRTGEERVRWRMRDFLKRTGVLVLGVGFWLVAGVLPVTGAGAAGAAKGGTKKPSGFPEFMNQFVYGLVVLEAGKAFLIDGQGKPAPTALATGARIKTGAVVGTGEAEGAVLRLGCGSLLRLGPKTRLKVLPYSVVLEEGACRARHINQYFPLKVDGKATILLTREGVADFETREGKVLVQVQVGKVRALGIKEPVQPGQTIEASGRQARLTDERPGWTGLTGTADVPAGVMTELVSAFDAVVAAGEAAGGFDGEAQAKPPAEPSAAPPVEPVPVVGTPKPVEPPAGAAKPAEGGAVEGEDWMKEPVSDEEGGQ
ncbi:MAG: hypothetical protein GX442_04095 [Candidatus Riflebacteria bacterium]|nr:hypothetical protein [Candidatus Riflebacteria bacterium]